MSKQSNKNNTNFNCFTTIFQTLLCSTNLPNTHSSCSSDQIVEKPGKIHPLSNLLSDPSDNIALKTQVVHQVNSPGIVAKLMGLDSLPYEYDKITNDMLFRSKSLNSLHFLPDFSPTRRGAFHRRARTSASFHEQGHTNKFLAKIDENLIIDDGLKIMKNGFDEVGFGCMKKQRKKEVVLKGENESKKSRQKCGGRIKDCGSKNKKYDECYYASSISRSNYVREKSGMVKKKLLVNNKGKSNRRLVDSSTNLTSRKKVDHKHKHKQDMCVDVSLRGRDDVLPSRSPIYVLDHHKEFPPIYKETGEGGKPTSKSRRKSSPKVKINDRLPQEIMPKSKQKNHKIGGKHKVVKAEEEIADNFVEMLDNICKLAEEQSEDSNWIANYDLLKIQFEKELCVGLAQELLGLLLDELMDELIM